MSSVTPLIVTHPCALVRDGLRPILAKSPFRPVHILPALNEETESYLAAAGVCIWLVGVNEYRPTTNDLVRRAVAANPSLRAVILAASHTAADILARISSRSLRLPPSRHPEQAAHQVLGVGGARPIRDASALSADGPHLACRVLRPAKCARSSRPTDDRKASIRLFPPRLADMRLAGISRAARASSRCRATTSQEACRAASW